LESWDVVVVGAGPSALRAAIASADSGAESLIVDGFGVGSASGAQPVAGLAASIDELDSTSHRDDTISAGGDSTDSTAAARTCGEAVATLTELERWGLVLRRREGGLPHAAEAPGHTVGRLTGCGDSTVREVTRLLEEQAIKRRIQRRSDLVPIQLVTDNQQVRGLVAYDVLSGELKSIQAKAVILATEGHQGLWSNPNDGPGTGAALALSAGIQLRGMDSIPMHPLTARDCNMHIPLDVLGSGGRIRRESGDDVGPEEVLGGEPCVLDLRGLEFDAIPWFAQTASRVRDRLGLDITTEVLPITSGVAATTGGIPCDESGRVTFDGHTEEGLPAKLWYTGLYSAGRSAHNGMHGEGMLPGNLMLDDMVSGKAAGTHAAQWIQKTEFGNSSIFNESVKAANDIILSMEMEGGLPVGQATEKLTLAMREVDGTPNEAALSRIREIKEAGIRVADQSRIMNTELVSAIRLKGLVLVAEAIASPG